MRLSSNFCALPPISLYELGNMTRRPRRETVFLFPAGLPEAIAFAASARAGGARVIGASSLRDDPASALYDEWVSLPYVHESDFEAALLQNIERYAIDTIFSSHHVIRPHLNRLLHSRASGIAIIGASALPPTSAVQKPGATYRDHLAFVADLRTKQRAKPIGSDEYAAVLAHSLQIRGESGTDKLMALIAIATSAPVGDVVEIGVLSGRSAFVLGWLARRHAIGRTLCIDPWRREDAIQLDALEMVRLSTQEHDFDAFFDEFKSNLLPSFYETVNYVRDNSWNVVGRYREGFVVGPTEFGTTRYHGAISLIHIDGNHDYAAVARDLSDWAPLVVGDGWIVIDDYTWTFGDGPKRAADQFLDSCETRFSLAFVAGGALFVQKN